MTVGSMGSPIRHRMASKVLGNSDGIGSNDSAVMLVALSESPIYQV